MVWFASYYYFNDEMLTILTGGCSVTLIYMMWFQFTSECFNCTWQSQEEAYLNDWTIVKIWKICHFFTETIFFILETYKTWQNMKRNIVFSNFTLEFASKYQIFILSSILCKTHICTQETQSLMHVEKNHERN